jgi:hypothetical protein
MNIHRDYIQWNLTREHGDAELAKNDSDSPFNDPTVRRRIVEIIVRAAAGSQNIRAC